MANDLLRLRKELQAQLDEKAHALYLVPQPEPFQHGVQVGRAQQLKEVIDLIDSRRPGDED